ncbi:MAG: HupE/UreJ family protein [Flavicella sp.]
MNNFLSYFNFGWDHIVDINAVDHLLFVMTLCAAFKLNQWKQVLVIITAFTIGHSVTLIISALELIPEAGSVIELLILLTIMITAISNIVLYNKEGRFSNKNIKYIIAMIFGLVHGLAFASNFKGMMFNSSIIKPLFAFNVGIEVGQLVVVTMFMGALFVYSKVLKGDHMKWNVFISGAGFGIAAKLFLDAL